MAADLATGASDVLPEEVPVVVALLAATAVSPIFPPQELQIDGEPRVLIDGVNIANEPTRPALAFLRRRAADFPAGAPAADSEARLADGGVMDNLPLDAVAQHLPLAAKVGLVRRRPEVPHLLFSASLEREVRKLSGEEAAWIAESWVR